MKNLKTLCATSLLALTMTAGIALPGHAEDKMKMDSKMDHKMNHKMAPKMDHKMSGGHMMSCPACKMMGNKMSAMDKKEIDHMASMMSSSEKKTYAKMSASEKALLGKAMKAGMMHGKTMGMMHHKM